MDDVPYTENGGPKNIPSSVDLIPNVPHNKFMLED